MLLDEVEPIVGEGLEGVCAHKDLFPLNAVELPGLVVVLGILAFANAGGLGGGGIVIPAMMSLYHFDTRTAVAISNFSIAISTGIRAILNFNTSNPLKNGMGTLHDYNIASLSLPGIIIGASVGSIVNLSLPAPI